MHRENCDKLNTVMTGVGQQKDCAKQKQISQLYLFSTKSLQNTKHFLPKCNDH